MIAQGNRAQAIRLPKKDREGVVFAKPKPDAALKPSPAVASGKFVPLEKGSGFD